MAFVVPSSYSKSYLSLPHPRISSTKQVSFGIAAGSVFRQPCLKLSIFSGGKTLSKGTNAAISDTPLLGTIDVLDAFEDDYGGIVVNSTSLPNTSNAFSSSLQSSLCYWNKQTGNLNFICFTFFLGGLCLSSCRARVLVVKEGKCPSHCSDIWKIPTGFVDKFEDLFSGAIREVREETGIESCFLDVVAFRHAHQVLFDKSDILFICTLKPLSSDISIDESEIEAARWMPVEEFVSQPFHQEDEMSRAITDICISAHHKCYAGLAAHQVMSMLDNRVAYLYTGDTREATGMCPRDYKS
uniref:Nudix hydrolase domain-containing protein n=1 Tax=Oryza barthii TaxID=65489 RepID=A0A0D3F2P3_9ORYZ